MRIVMSVLCAAVCVSSVGAQQPAKYVVERATVARIAEVRSGQVTRRAEKGEFLEVRALVRPPAVGATMRVEDVKLAGSSRDATASSKWDLSAVGFGAEYNGRCSYTFPGDLVRGSIGFAGGVLVLTREKEGDPAILEFSRTSVEMCAVFLVPAGANGPLTLHVGGSRFPATWK